METQTDLTIHIQHAYNHQPERVFDAWLDPALIRKWFSPELGPFERIEVDRRVGGRFSIAQIRDGEVFDHIGKYLTVERPNHLVFTFGIAGFGKDTTIEVRIQPADTGCLLELSTELPPDYAEYLDRTRDGWTRLTANIDNVLDAESKS